MHDDDPASQPREQGKSGGPEETITRILGDIESKGGDAGDLMPVLYDELRALAGRYMRQERRDHTLQPTALVHEAFARLADNACASQGSRGHFLAAAANVMRRVLIDHARTAGREKRGRDWQRVSLDRLVEDAEETGIDVLSLHEALERLATLDARQAQIVELRFFGGMTGDEIAAHLGISRSTVVRELTMARAWLRAEME